MKTSSWRNIAKSEWQGVEAAMTGSRYTFNLICAQCGAKSTITDSRRLPPEAVCSRFHRQGWVTGGRPMCPSCASSKRPRLVIDNLKFVEAEEMSAEKVIEDAATSEAAKKAKRLIYFALEDYYDDVAKRYKDGRSDKSVAAEIGVAEAFVKKIREEDFGPLSEPDEVAKLRADLSALSSEIGKLTTKLNDLCVKNGWRA